SEAAQELGYGPELLALVAASRSEIEKVRRQRRQRTFRVFAGLAVFSLVLSVLGLVAWNQRRNAQRGAEAQRHLEEGRRLLEQGRVLLDGHPMQALPYLVAARAEGIEGAAIRMWFEQASRSIPLVTLEGHGSSVTRAMFSPDGKW